MRKLVFTLFAAGSLMVANTAIDAEASANPGTSYSQESAQQVAATEKADVKSGTFKTKFNSNIRLDAGTSNNVVMVAEKGSTVTATHQKKVGSAVWYKVNVSGTSGWVLSTLLAPASAGTASTAAKTPAVSQVSNPVSSSEIVSNALALKGTPYMYGGASPAGFDCSGFVQYVFNQSGKDMSRSTLSQFAETTTVSDPQVGDLVFFANTYRAGISHVGIYIGNNEFVHSGGAKAEVRSLDESYWKQHFHSFKRK